MQPQTATEPTAPIGQTRYHRRLTRRYHGDAEKARAVKGEIVRLRGLIRGNRARLFADKIRTAAELRVLADDARAQALASPPSGDAWVPVWRLEREAQRAEAELMRHSVPGLLDSLGADASGAALLAALGIGPNQQPATETEEALPATEWSLRATGGR